MTLRRRWLRGEHTAGIGIVGAGYVGAALSNQFQRVPGMPVVMDGLPLGDPTLRPVADVVAVAKKDLTPGEVTDGLGGLACYGQIDAAERAAGYLPMGFTDHARVIRPVAADQSVPLDAVELDADAQIVRLRARQDALLQETG